MEAYHDNSPTINLRICIHSYLEMSRFIIFSILFIIFAFRIDESLQAKKFHYTFEETVPFQIKGIGPYNNPSEVYKYESLPLCKSTEAKLGVQYYEIPFLIPIVFAKSCSVHLVDSDIEVLKKAIDKNYYVRMQYDRHNAQIPIGFTADPTEDHPKIYYLFKHLHFNISYNEDEIVFAEIIPDINRIDDLSLIDEPIVFSYSANWQETTSSYKEMKDQANTISMMEPRIHWLSIINSLVLILLLTGFLAIIIMRVLKLDIDRYSKREDEESEEIDEDEYGWKLVYGDVFRFPPLPNLFSAFIGLGTQCITISYSYLILSALGIFYETSKFSYIALAVVLYGFASVIGGYVSSQLYKQLNGSKWAWNIVLEIVLLILPIVVVFSIINTVAVVYHANVTPITATITIISIIVVVGIPLTLIGGISGKRFGASSLDAPVKTRIIPREIPTIPWFRSLPFAMLMSGVLPFSAIYIELFYLFTSVWGYSTYELYGILILVAIILLIVTACVTVAFTYFQLSMEDYRWWWSSFFMGGSTGLFIYAYSIFYYIYRSQMNGVVQATYFFLWMLIICYFIFVMLGSIGYYSSLFFIRKIYSACGKFD